MSPLHLLVALLGVAVTIVLGQDPYNFANPPPLPEKGTLLFASLHEQSRTHILRGDPPLVQNAYRRLSTEFHQFQETSLEEG